MDFLFILKLFEEKFRKFSFFVFLRINVCVCVCLCVELSIEHFSNLTHDLLILIVITTKKTI